MLDRASSFVVPGTIQLLSDSYVPVAVDEWYEVRRRDPVGDYYRHVVLQRQGASLDRTTQGFYVFAPDGTLWRAWNNRDPEKLRRILADCAHALPPAPARPGEGGPARSEAFAGPATAEQPDARYDRSLPEGARVAEVFTRILQQAPSSEGSPYDQLFRQATGRDHLWILPDERESLARGDFPARLLRRIARFHLVDDTRGEPPHWRSDEVHSLDFVVHLDAITLQEPGVHEVEFSLQSADGARRFQGSLYASWDCAEDGALSRFDVAARGVFEGHGQWTSNAAPTGPFVLGVAIRLADPALPASRVPPQGARDLRGYLRAD